MSGARGPIAGPGSEVFGFASGWCWCGSCGYTGRVAGPRQKVCPEFIWHAWLRQCADLESFLRFASKEGGRV